MNQPLLVKMNKAKKEEAELSRGLDREFTTSCGHTWTMRHTACPTCFVELRAVLRLIVKDFEGYDSEGLEQARKFLEGEKQESGA